MAGQWKRTRAYFPERFLPVLSECEEISRQMGFDGDVNQLILEGLMRVVESFRTCDLKATVADRERLAHIYLNGSLDANGKF